VKGADAQMNCSYPGNKLWISNTWIAPSKNLSISK